MRRTRLFTTRKAAQQQSSLMEDEVSYLIVFTVLSMSVVPTLGLLHY